MLTPWDLFGSVGRINRMRALSIAALCLLASACMSGGASGSSQAAPGSTNRSTPPPTAVSSVRSPRTIETPSFIQATFPAAWYGQQYGTAEIAITSFPVHLMIDSVRAIPADGAVLTILDTTPKPRCDAAPRPRRPLRLGHFNANYEMFGAAYRIQFLDRGHNIVVFVSFGSHARPSVRRAASNHSVARRVEQTRRKPLNRAV